MDLRAKYASLLPCRLTDRFIEKVPYSNTSINDDFATVLRHKVGLLVLFLLTLKPTRSEVKFLHELVSRFCVIRRLITTMTHTSLFAHGVVWT